MVPDLTSLIFFPDKKFYEKPEDYDLDYENAEIVTSDGAKLHGWFLKAAKPRGAVLNFHGNAGNISGRLYKMKGWVDRGFSVLLVDYRGYGKSSGQIRRQDDVVRDAEAALDWLKEKFALSKIILYGESLGTHPAIRLAVENRAATVILEAPYTSFFDLVGIHYPAVPREWIRDFSFPNKDWIAKIKSPLFVLHGTLDETCPHSMSGDLFDLAPEPKAFFTIPNGHHNDLPMVAGEDFWEKPAEFVEKFLK